MSKNPSANMVKRMENLRSTVNMGRLQEEGQRGHFPKKSQKKSQKEQGNGL